MGELLHRKHTAKLGMKSQHRRAMLANMVCSLIEHSQIRTTIAKAKEARRFADDQTVQRERLRRQRGVEDDAGEPLYSCAHFDPLMPGDRTISPGFPFLILEKEDKHPPGCHGYAK